ncbi:MAG: polyphosphate polymerase domain-containing protein [Verrucomicrobiales bacterium]|nr:polyphosphate polymerase domain-containing protein [Verrucomicrobiales bacterium]
MRYERKLLPGDRPLPEVLGIIRRHPAGFREVYPARWVNNLYLDSPALGDYHDHVTGLPERSKCRIRWYGSLHGSVEAPRFEWKFKQGAVSGKRAHPLPPLELNGGIDDSMLRRMINGAAAKNPLQDRLDARQPSLVNRYRRHYFESADGAIRLTVDSDLGFFSPDRTADSAMIPAPRDSRVVIELKYHPEAAGRAAKIASEFPWRLARCSKYVLGIEATHRT